MGRRSLRYSAVACLLLFGAIQFIQPDRKNPPINPAATFEAVAHPAPEVAAIVNRACRDCHSYNTVWPWYSHMAPVSWLIADDVKGGRAHLNFSEWSFLSPEMSAMKLKEACRELKDGGMPLWQYKLIHPEARLSQADIDNFCKATGPIADLR